MDEAIHLPPVRPSKIIAVHLNYRSRVEDFCIRLPDTPTYFHKPTTALNAHNGAVVRPERRHWLYYEPAVRCDGQLGDRLESADAGAAAARRAGSPAAEARSRSVVSRACPDLGDHDRAGEELRFAREPVEAANARRGCRLAARSWASRRLNR